MKFERRELGLDELKAIIERAGHMQLGAPEQEKLVGAIDTLALLTQELEAKGASIVRLRTLLFGASTEKTSQVFPAAPAAPESGADSQPGGADKPADESLDKPAGRRPGHGRNGAASYPGATKVCLLHGTLHSGERCPECLKGKLYAQPQPAVLVRIRGMAPLGATLYELERLRCSLCGEVFTATAQIGRASCRERVSFGV